MNDKKFKDIVSDDLKIDLTKLPEAAAVNTFTQNKYSSMLRRESMKLHKLNIKYNIMWREKFLYYKFDYEYDLSKENKNVITKFVESDPEIVKIQIELKNKEELVNYLERVVESFNKRSWDISNAVKMITFLGENG